MYSSVSLEIPEFLSDQVVYCDNLNHKRGYRTCFLLTKHLKFYEFHQKCLVNCIDLNNTILHKISECFHRYQGPNGKWFKVDNNQSVSGDHEELPSRTDEQHIKFGKFYYFNLNIRKLYILIQCWDKLVVVQRENENGPLLQTAEYEDVSQFKVVNGPIKLQAVVEVHFRNGQVISTDFQESTTDTQTPNNFSPQMQSNDFQQLLDSIKGELQIQKKITQGRLNELSNARVFGSVQQRSQKLEEKQKLSKLGDVWIRLPPNGCIVIGVPLVNNCTSPNLNVLRNLKPIIKSKEATTKIHDISNYEHYLYKLEMQFVDLESLETFLQTEDERLQATTWSRAGDQLLLPQSFGVLVIKFPVAQLINVSECQLLLSFEVAKTSDIDEIFKPKTLTHEEQQIFLKDLNFSDILNSRKSYEISFSNLTLHQDFLAIAATSTEMQFSIKFLKRHDAETFEHLLTNTFDLKIMDEKIKARSFNMDDTIEMKDDCGSCGQLALPHLYYNENPSSFWYGLLVLKLSYSYSDETDGTWKFYTRTQEHAHLFLRQLFQDHLIRNCNMQDINCSGHSELSKDLQMKDLENALRLELKCLIELAKSHASDSSYTAEMFELKKLQMYTDCSMASIVK